MIKNRPRIRERSALWPESSTIVLGTLHSKVWIGTHWLWALGPIALRIRKPEENATQYRGEEKREQREIRSWIIIGFRFLFSSSFLPANHAREWRRRRHRPSEQGAIYSWAGGRKERKEKKRYKEKRDPWLRGWMEVWPDLGIIWVPLSFPKSANSGHTVSGGDINGLCPINELNSLASANVGNWEKGRKKERAYVISTLHCWEVNIYYGTYTYVGTGA